MQGTETAFECALLFYFYFWDSQSHRLYTMEQQYNTFHKISDAQYLQILLQSNLSFFILQKIIIFSRSVT